MNHALRTALPVALALPALGVAALLAGCGDDGGSRRVIAITQTNDDCTPHVIDLKTNEAVRFEVTNKGDRGKELEGIDGTKLEELLVPEDRTRSVNYTAPGSEGVQKVKCYVPGGSSTIIELHVTQGGPATAANDDDAAHAANEESLKTDRAAQATVAVSLIEFKVEPDRLSVGAGPTKFVATNTSTTMVHELAVLRLKDDGSFANTGEIEDIAPGAKGEVTLDLPKGKYVLACLLVPGEADSRFDHFKEGMKIDFEVD